MRRRWGAWFRAAAWPLVLAVVPAYVGAALASPVRSEVRQQPPPAPALDAAAETPTSTSAGQASESEKAGQETRAELLRQRRLDKANGPLTPYDQGSLERLALVAEKAERPTFLDYNLYGAYPRYSSIDRGADLAPGIRFWQPDIGGSVLDIHGSFFLSPGGYELYEAQVGLVPHEGAGMPARSIQRPELYRLGDLRRSSLSHLILYAAAQRRHMPERRFYGLGSESRPEDRSNFLQTDESLALVVGYQPVRAVGLILSGTWRDTFIGVGEGEESPATQELFDDTTAPGLERGAIFLNLRAEFIVDFRDIRGNPHRGGLLAASVERFSERGSGEFDFTRYAVDARGFLPLGSHQRVLAVRAYLSYDDPEDGGRVPFYLQESLGDSHTLRGFDSLRFRGAKIGLVQAEYRWEAAPTLELAAFVDAAAIATQEGDLSFSELETDWGLGLRLKTWNASMFRLDWATSNETTRLIVRFSNSF